MSAGLYRLPYNGTNDYGGDSATDNFNIWYESGDFAWIITASALVLLMIPGVGFFYSGLARRKSALSLVFLSMIGTAIVGFEWFFWGFSLTFSKTGGAYIGNLHDFGLMKTLGAPIFDGATVPDLLFCLFQGMFASITPVIAIGAAADRARILPCMVFIFVWSTIVYNPIACWTWGPHGWSLVMGGLDFAGGTPVHISSGFAALAYALMLGKRTGYTKTHGLPHRPHNVTHVVLGTVFLWVGWFGFNGGSTVSANMRAVMACIVTHLAACCGGITWCLLDYRLDKKWSVVGFCSGAITGLVAITPGSGYVPAWSAVIFGVVGSIVCNFATKIKFLIGIDEGLDVWAVHGIGGIVGNILTGFFAADYIAHLDGVTSIPGGWLNHHYVQLGYQIADSVAGASYSFVMTCIILGIMNFIPGLSLRCSSEAEELGLDDAELGEFAYDYVEITRQVIPSYAGSEAHSEAEKNTAVPPNKSEPPTQ